MVQIDQQVCIGCGKCVSDCVERKIILTENKAMIEQECLKCGHCVAICPVNAVSIPEYEMAEVEKYIRNDFELDPEVLLRAIKFRRSIRSYQQKSIDREQLDMLVQAGRYTATAKNNQGTRFIIVQKELQQLKDLVWGNIDEMVKSQGREMPRELLVFAAFSKRRRENPPDDYLFRNAPVVMFITSDWPLDAGLAAQNVELMAAAQGLGALYNGYLTMISEQNIKLKKWLQIEDTTIRACFLLGYPAVTYQRTAPREQATVVWK